ncbi:MAG TPA: DNA mismatch repair protein MutS [bacterium]|nr:DNA mismatch repair protein MutS [bacterium]HOL48023.1 DNA mismatch repair protein MutS [bacterium]HPQ19571.1 DNA mismatch repair protein MutS [bacterium]
MQDNDLTPMMRQYNEIKKKYKDTIIFFRLGDFYEMFYEDAKIGSKVLQLVLTQRKGIPMCGVPHHSVRSYLYKMLKAGYKVALCDQLEDPKFAKGIVKRDVTRIMTPGTLTEDDILDEKSNNYLASIYASLNNNLVIGLSFLDISTGDFFTTEIESSSSIQTLINEIIRFSPSEILIPEDFKNNFNHILEKIKIETKVYIFPIENWKFDFHTAKENLLNLFNVIDLDGYGLKDKTNAIQSAGAIIEYLKDTQKTSSFEHINKIQYYNPSKYMILDAATIRNLEIIQSINQGEKNASLFFILDETETNAGARLLKKWLLQPLKDVQEINKRLFSVKYFYDNNILRNELKKLFKSIVDIERILSRINCNRANGKDLIALKNSLKILPQIFELLKNCDNKFLKELINEIDLCSDIYELIEKSIEDDPPVTITEGGLIKINYNEEIKKYKTAKSKGTEWLKNYQEEERQKTGISSLKVSFNKVFGYFIEVTKVHKSKVPDYYEIKQTLVNSERYTTKELKEYENLIFEAEEKLIQLEYEIFNEIRRKISKETKRIQKTSSILAQLDVYLALAEIAKKNNYTQPIVNDSNEIIIKNSRHPVIEKLQDSEFIPNDVYLNNDDTRLYIITGPNMAGKSTFIRQVALNVLMAQIGSFIPASEATIGIVDRIFTRIGASDNLVKGLSTFMVEMIETANILNNATSKSLIILDEIGRGTSTFDGLSLAWAIAEYILDKKIIGAKTLFATHYHELSDLANLHKGVQNYNVAVREWNGQITFLRKIVKGSVDKSYGIEVARLAGIPEKVINRAKEILQNLEKQELNLIESAKPIEEKQIQLTLFSLEQEEYDWINEIKNLDINKMTPLDALNKIAYIKEKIKNLKI